MAKKKTRAKVITAAAIKGGTGKTATAGALAQAAAKDGRAALIIDLDPQGSLSYWHRADMSRPNSYDVITGRADPAAAIQPTESGPQLICGSANLTALATKPGSARRLERAIEPLLSEYDLIIIDTAPAMGEAQNLALFASTGVILTAETDAYSLQSLYQTADIVRLIQDGKPALRILGTVVTKYDSRAKINRVFLDAIKEKGADIGAPFLTAIRIGVAIREAMAMQTSLFDYAPKSRTAQDYKDLFQRIMEAAT